MVDVRAWVKKQGDPAVARALAALAKLPASKKPGRVGIPFPVGDVESPYDKVIGHKSLQRRITTAPVEDVPTDKLVSNGQKTVRKDQVAHYIAHGDTKGMDHGGKHPTDHPIVVKVGGKHVTFDGHHRVTAAILRGEKTVKARVVDLDAKLPEAKA